MSTNWKGSEEVRVSVPNARFFENFRGVFKGGIGNTVFFEHLGRRTERKQPVRHVANVNFSSSLLLFLLIVNVAQEKQQKRVLVTITHIRLCECSKFTTFRKTQLPDRDS